MLNNTSTDKIFKYTVSGTLQGSWTISGGGGSPTGLTIDPANVSDIWIVDCSTASGTATSGSDFTQISGTVTFAPGQTSQTILVQTVNIDTAIELDETFTTGYRPSRRSGSN